jgi:hypothetical protein
MIQGMSLLSRGVILFSQPSTSWTRIACHRRIDCETAASSRYALYERQADGPTRRRNMRQSD